MRAKTQDYIRSIARKHSLNIKKTSLLLHFITKNFCRIIEDGQDMRISGFGHVYFNKKHYLKYKKAIKDAKKRRSS